jgi:outer membrane protein OmpA-like peptidoglycan-associated protein
MNAIRLFAFPLAAVLGACAGDPPPELKSAHSAFDRVASGPANELVPADVHAAKEQLALADQSFQDHGSSPATRDLAYAAERRADLAAVHAQTAAETKQQQDADAQLQALKDQQVQTTSAELSSARQQLQTQGQALAMSEQERAAADRRAQQAAADLARIASVKQEPRGMVITLSGGVLFASAKWDLLPQAQVKLNQVAGVLSKQDKDSKIVVQGYTDSQGGASFNQDLSQHRADSVRSFLVSHGIASDRVTAQGFGPSNPVADNASPEGRADNRRVEIVVQPRGGSSTDNGPSSTTR